LNKRRWIYIGEGGSRSTVGIIHNASKGQFMIYCNKKIVLLEFKLYESKQFTFFLNDELFKIDVIKTGNTYQYAFKVDMEAQTPLNKERTQLKKTTLKQSILAIIVSLATVAIIISTVLWLHGRRFQKAREANGVYAIAQMYINPKQSGSFSLGYSFSTQYSNHFHQVEYYKTPHPMSPTGFPFYDGDEFYVQYAINDASNHEIFYDRPTEKQINTYKRRALEKHLENNTNAEKAYCECLIEKAFIIKKVDGLAIFHHQNTPPSQNRRFNIKAYKELIYSDDFKKEADKCLSK
jgi:hypothetical protein